MFIHLGNNITISDKKLVGIFNVETILKSQENSRFFSNINDGDKLIAIDIFNKTITSSVSPFTVIKRDSLLDEDLIWSNDND
ncbi:MAG TPA: hypothetical protein PKX79_05975 [Spirochaetota bacterium]|jgi:23S rRNA pseudoU1915 N3-methylase RlmH|nr:MAG: hypothetical protein BWY23_02526 [Spirochaetes bacterium ADurb.Bin218]HOK92348.1 hypothetical protein [Spirochaetota bacterium]HOQ11543.1 hypothetical protein [Spirochaetota bacterium]HPP94909.1 hypothetical protein [Spirochaetota bacterium]